MFFDRLKAAVSTPSSPLSGQTTYTRDFFCETGDGSPVRVARTWNLKLPGAVVKQHLADQGFEKIRKRKPAKQPISVLGQTLHKEAY